VRNVNNVNYNIRYDVYDLPTATLSTSEIQLVDFVAFPNPTSKKLSLINPKNGNTSIEIYDLNGKKVLHKTFSDLEDKISIDVEKLSNGVYVYKIGSLSSKFIKN
ncbi:MAG: T9SS type A sorting domain-containing protein, partial [Flavobacteriaceae bacterium]|nr:T9SS type A sorting domain-containing protein [Flavobacteriaceae bacterium]